MSKRFLAAIAGIAFGVAMATAAHAREHGGIPTPIGQHGWDSDDDERPVRSERKYRRQQATRRSHQATRRARGDAQATSTPATRESRKQARRGGGKPVASAGGGMRNCLTPAARALLGRIEAQFGPMQIISTCRPGARIAGSGRISRHASGNAVDFSAGGRKAAVVRWLIANHKSGGTMTYANMGHIHVDIGPRFVSLNAHGG